MKYTNVTVDLREVIGKVLVDEEADKAYTILEAQWNDKTSAPMLVLEERNEK